MASPEIKLIAFDLDGTLLDSVPDLAIAADLAVKSFDYPSVSEEQVRDWVGNGADLLIARALSQSMIVDPSLTPELLQQARIRFDDFYQQGGHTEGKLYPSVKETLTALHKLNIPMAIVTNKPSQFVPDILAQHELSAFFTDTLGGDAFEQKKPDPIALNWLMEKYKVSANEMLMVGDSKNDILAAKNANCHSFALTYGYNHGEDIRDSNPDYVADNIDQLLKIISTN